MLTLVFVGGCAAASPATRADVAVEPEAGPDADPPSDGAPRVLGLQLGAPLASVRARHPTISLTADPRREEVVGALPLRAAGVELQAQLAFFEGRLAQVSGTARGTSRARFEALVGQLEQELGPGRPMICGSDAGEPFADYLASGRGSVSREWNDQRVWASVSLRSLRLSTGELSLSLHAMWLPLTSRHADDDFKGAPRKQASPSPRAVARGPSACPEVGPTAPSFHGVLYGSSAAEAARILGAVATPERGRLTVPHRIGGIDGELTLSFWDDCMASVFFVAPGSVESYRAIQAELLGDLGAPERRERCSPTGAVPSEDEIARTHGSLQTLWSDETRRGQVRLSATTPREAPQVIVDLSFLPLGGRAPQIDFAAP